MPTSIVRRPASLVLLTLLALPLSLATAQSVAPPTLVVEITVDQLRPDYFDRFAPQLSGGLGRLMRNGARFTNAFHDHATTETAPGHATLWSYDRATRLLGYEPKHTWRESDFAEWLRATRSTRSG